MNYSVETTDLIHNENGMQFYKMLFDDKCLFDEFLCNIDSVAEDKRHFASLVALMNMYSPHLLLPKAKFNHIEDVGRSDVFEFKKDNLRVYVLIQKPNVFIILGGYKTQQKDSIRRIKRLTKELPTFLKIDKLTNNIQL